MNGLTRLGAALGFLSERDDGGHGIRALPPQPLMPQLADSARSAPSRGLPPTPTKRVPDGSW